jgi:hypothetical protein
MQCNWSVFPSGFAAMTNDTNLYIFTDRYWSESLSYMKDDELKVVRASDYDKAIADLKQRLRDIDACAKENDVNGIRDIIERAQP